MSSLALSRRWRSGVGTGKSLALRDTVSRAMAAGVRPIAYLPAAVDVGLSTERVDLPHSDVVSRLGAAELVGRLTRNLSSGERQRVRLAAALSTPICFAALDEPCRHLDPHHVEALNSLLLDRHREAVPVGACDARALLDRGLFELDGDVLNDDGIASGPASAPHGDALEVEVPTPFLLSAEARKTGRLLLRIERGALVVVRGPNGGGKTSLLSALARASRRSGRRVGFSRQDPEHQVFAPSLGGELNDIAEAHDGAPWCKSSSRRGFDMLVTNLGLHPWSDRPTLQLPLGVLSLLGTAAALWIGHDLVLLDEPSQMLDLRTVRRLAGELKRCAESGARIVVATHDPEVVRVANQLWNVEAGRLDTGLRS